MIALDWVSTPSSSSRGRRRASKNRKRTNAAMCATRPSVRLRGRAASLPASPGRAGRPRGLVAGNCRDALHKVEDGLRLATLLGEHRLVTEIGRWARSRQGGPEGYLSGPHPSPPHRCTRRSLQRRLSRRALLRVMARRRVVRPGHWQSDNLGPL
jgi:hypothetical protein